MKFIGHLLISLACLFITTYCNGQTSEVPSFKLYLIGDAGEGDTAGPTLRDLRVKLLANPNSAVIFLGDNCYLKTFISSLFNLEVGGFNGSKFAQRRLMSHVGIMKEYKGSA